MPVAVHSQDYDPTFEVIMEEIKLNQASNSIDSAKAIFAWVTSNISYDTQRKFIISTSRDTFLELAHKVAEERKAVCLGYAALFKKLCDFSNLDAYVVKGIVFIPEEDAFESHAWVVFKSNQRWHIADPTWGAGFVAGYRFTYHQNWSFFDPQPSEFISTHYPLDPAFQLLEKPINYQGFFKSSKDPKYRSEDFPYDSILSNELSQADPKGRLRRALQFKPADPFLMHDLATYLQEDASSFVHDCVSEYNLSGKISKNSDCKEQINKAEKLLQEAINIYEKLLEMDAPQKDTAWMNLAASKNNLKTIQILKQNTY